MEDRAANKHFKKTAERDASPVVPLKFAVLDKERRLHIAEVVDEVADVNFELDKEALFNSEIIGEPFPPRRSFRCSKKLFNKDYFYDAVNAMANEPPKKKEERIAAMEARFRAAMEEIDDLPAVKEARESSVVLESDEENEVVVEEEDEDAGDRPGPSGYGNAFLNSRFED